ncbi:hypothetical protein TanjilG_26331 [Lupinus angustifolius]|uniref:RWP-RK domain-containing protein n=1 Tax=Lupinus angustifolius TaxID=3871 RepID=A0A4P1R356_LUPAN|nr:PREDICTED: protein RKD1-like [Lupinus angustifolius]OIV99993.1 hypothetical protein TanjilG_26331 [Lupinus angustifolius]
MESKPTMIWESNYEIDENPFPITYQFKTYDYHMSGNVNGYPALDNWPQEIPELQDSYIDPVTFMESFYSTNPLYETPTIEPISSVQLQDYDFYDTTNGFSVWNEIDAEFEESGKEMMEDEKFGKGKRVREDISVSTMMLSRETISQYFYMPITQAARELNVGLTLLKKRCRELGIRRWPHRKLMSLQTLINNVQELGRNGEEESEMKLRNAIEMLEREKKMLEEIPDMQLGDTTKRLRQACFKATYKKRMLMGMMQSQSSTPYPTSPKYFDTI